MVELYLEDFSPGQIFRAGPSQVTADAIKQFAGDFDPQPFHLDEAAAERSFFKGLAASGWHTAAITMRLMVQAVPIAGGIIGAGVDELRWLAPVRPDDLLRVEVEVLEVRVGSRPMRGWVKMRNSTFNQGDVAVQSLIANLMVPARPAHAAP
jgi:acyl dehydratase